MAGGDPLQEVEAARRLLGVAPGANAHALRLAYLAAVKAAHPDRAGGDSARLRAVIEAYARLRAARQAAPPPPDAALEITPHQAMRGGVAEVVLGAGRIARVELPAGLRHGDRVGLSGRTFRIAVRSDGGVLVLGDHLCVTIQVEPGQLGHGGRVLVDALAGPKAVWVSAGDAARGIVRVPGHGLPARGDRPAGDLFVRLTIAPMAADEGPLCAKRRRFASRWAA